MKNTSRAYFIFYLKLTFVLEAHASEKHCAWCFAAKKVVPAQKAIFKEYEKRAARNVRLA